ncbi:MAG: restriction endonuclease subunit S [Candidatus Phytoplasma sp. TWB_XP]
MPDGKYYVMNGGTKPSGYYNKYNMSAHIITVSSGGSCGYVHYHFKSFWCGGDAFYLKSTNDIINYKYLYQFLKYHENNLRKLGTGTGLKHISKLNLSNFLITFPDSLEEQTKIADFYLKWIHELIPKIKSFKI